MTSPTCSETKLAANLAPTNSSESPKNHTTFCPCRDCFKKWWNSLSPVMKNRISHWQYYIDMHSKSILRRVRSEANVGATETGVGASTYDDGVEVILPNMEDWSGYGERLHDDTIDIYCDRVQRAAQAENKRIEGCFAIQTVHGNFGVNFSKLITGLHMVLQVIYDESRTGHFLMLEWTPYDKIVVVYDSLVPPDHEADQTLTAPVRRQIQALFGHLYPDVIPVRIERHLEVQEDDWSCGLRVIGFLTMRALGRPANGVRFFLNKISELIDAIRAKHNPTMDDFKVEISCLLHEFRESIITVLEKE